MGEGFKFTQRIDMAVIGSENLILYSHTILHSFFFLAERIEISHDIVFPSV